MPNRISTYQPPRDDAIRSFASGLDSHQRKHHRLVMLQAYFDDSGSNPTDPVFVLGGLVSTVEKWEAFSDRWRRVLAQDPPLAYFKANEARNRTGDFQRGWTRELIDQRIFELTEVICDHAEHRISCKIIRSEWNHHVDSLKRIAGRELGIEYTSPYWVSFYSICLGVAHIARSTDQTLPCDFVFDEQGKLGAETVQWWQNLKTSMRPMARPFIGNAPSFHDDKVVVPLQASDLYSWFVHASYVKNFKQESEELSHIHQMFMRVPTVAVEYDRQKLRHLRRMAKPAFKAGRFAPPSSDDWPEQL